MKLRKRRPNIVSLDEPVEYGRRYDSARGRGLGAFAGRALRADGTVRHPFDCDRGTGPIFPNRFPIAGHRRIVDRRDGGGAWTFGACREIAAVACAAETAPEAESLFSKGRKCVKCKDIIQELANYFDEALDPVSKAVHRRASRQVQGLPRRGGYDQANDRDFLQLGTRSSSRRHTIPASPSSREKTSSRPRLKICPSRADSLLLLPHRNFAADTALPCQFIDSARNGDIFRRNSTRFKSVICEEVVAPQIFPATIPESSCTFSHRETSLPNA